MPDTLNWKEDRIVKTLKQHGPLSLVELGWRCFPGVRPKAKRLSQVRNSLRKPVRLRLAKRVDDGTYDA